MDTYPKEVIIHVVSMLSVLDSVKLKINDKISRPIHIAIGNT